MRRRTTLMMMGAVFASLIGAPAPAPAHHQCSPPFEVNYRHCGEHPRLSDLPLRFQVNLQSAPANVRPRFLEAARDAIDEWNRAWPLPTGNLSCPVVCLDGTTTQPAKLGDGKNTISFGSVNTCGGDAHGGLAVACVVYAGPTGAARHRIVEVDIILSKDQAWYQPVLLDGSRPDRSEPVGTLAGEATEVYPELGQNNQYDLIGNGRGKYDVQSTITHELGHAIGLEDIGNPDRAYPGSLDLTQYRQTMYRWHYRGTTFKRSLGEGDIAGLHAVALQALDNGG